MQFYTSNHIYKLIDLTLLNTQATSADILATYTAALQKSVAAICLYAENYQYLPKVIKDEHTNNSEAQIDRIYKATVINFPDGAQDTQQVLDEIQRAISLYNIDEIDYVFPYKTYLNNHKLLSLENCESVLNFCKNHNKTLKVIIESGAFPTANEIYELSFELASMGCDFIKTSTGKIANGATPGAALAILTAIKASNKNCGIKVSGGIRTLEQANFYINLAEQILQKSATKNWFRIGSSNSNLI